MGLPHLDNVERSLFEEFGQMDNELRAISLQKEKNEMILDEISGLIKKIVSGEVKEIFDIMGGTLVVKSSSTKDKMKMLQDRKKIFQNAVDALDGQIKNRKDDLAERALRLYALFYEKLKVNHGDPNEYIKAVIERNKNMESPK